MIYVGNAQVAAVAIERDTQVSLGDEVEMYRVDHPIGIVVRGKLDKDLIDLDPDAAEVHTKPIPP